MGAGDQVLQHWKAYPRDGSANRWPPDVHVHQDICHLFNAERPFSTDTRCRIAPGAAVAWSPGRGPTAGGHRGGPARFGGEVRARTGDAISPSDGGSPPSGSPRLARDVSSRHRSWLGVVLL